jgi:hypothetical protein
MRIPDFVDSTIRTDAGLRATRVVVGNLEEALLGLHRNRASYHPTTFELLAEPIRDQIRSLRADIDEYIGLPRAHEAHQPAPASADELTGTPQV